MTLVTPAWTNYTRETPKTPAPGTPTQNPTTPEHLLILRTPVPPVEVYQRTKEFKKEKLRFIDPNQKHLMQQ